MRFFVAASIVLVLAGCGEDADVVTTTASSTSSSSSSMPSRGTTLSMDFDAAKTSFYAAPFPSDTRLVGGAIDLSAFPKGTGAHLVDTILALLKKDATGYGQTSAIYFQATSALDPTSLPSVHRTVEEGASIFVADVDPKSPDRGKRYPLSVHYADDGGPFGAPHLLALLPYQGFPLPPKTELAAFVMKTLKDASGAPLDSSDALDKLLASDATYEDAAKAAGVDPTTVAGMTVFTTGDAFNGFGEVRDAMVAAPPVPSAPFVKTDDFADYCVYSTTIPMPEYQEGVPPYSSTGGDWVFDASGKPVLQRQEEANFVVSVPKQAMPASGYPLVVFSRTGGGGERPLVDRGVQAMTGGPALVPGTGPALYFAHAGWAGTSIDGPHGGLRNITHGNEDFLIFNVTNPIALRDNIRQSAAELSLHSAILQATTIDVSDCAGAGDSSHQARFDAKKMVIMGHSMGATISPLAFAFEPRFEAGLLSGSGGSWTENVIYKLEPLATKPLAETLLGLNGTGYSLNEWDPVLNFFQWAGEPADPPLYSSKIKGRHVLMMQGIVDTYILPPMANAESLSLGLDLAGFELDASNPALSAFTPLGDVIDLGGRKRMDLPVTSNFAPGVTAVVTQNQGDGIENGHEVVFQTNPPKHAYQCFLQTLAATGTPTVPELGSPGDPCN